MNKSIENHIFNLNEGLSDNLMSLFVRLTQEHKLSTLSFCKAHNTHMHTQLTSVQQQFDHREVGVGDSVVERCVPIAVRHVDHKLQQLRGHRGKGVHIGLDNSRVRSFVTGHAQPLL